jgi:TRAP-type C4-dicarboxylate transport system substrate-binding protein
MEETQAQHDAWWNSLTEEEKQKIADEAQTVSTYFDEQRADRDE